MKATVLVLALACAGAAFAQSPTPPKHAAHEAHMMDDLSTLLDLDATQRAQVQTILQEQHAQLRQQHAQMKQEWDAAKASGTQPDFSQMRARHEQLQQQTVQKLTPVLSPAQLAKFQILMKMHQGHSHHHGPPAASAGDAPAP